MTEAQIQAKYIKHLEKMDYYVIKLISTNKNGIPDLLAVKDGKATFIEMKKPGGRIAPLQKHRIDELRKFGAKAFVYDGENVLY